MRGARFVGLLVIGGLLLSGCASDSSKPNDVATGTTGGLVASLICFGVTREAGCLLMTAGGAAAGYAVQKRRDDLIRLRERSEAELRAYTAGYDEVNRILVTQGQGIAQLQADLASLRERRSRSQRDRDQFDRRVDELKASILQTRELNAFVRRELESTSQQIRDMETKTGGSAEDLERKIQGALEMRARMYALLQSATQNEQQYGKLLRAVDD